MIAILLRIFYNELSDEAGGTSFNAWAKYLNLTALDIDKKKLRNTFTNVTVRLLKLCQIKIETICDGVFKN